MLDSTKHFSGLPVALEPLATKINWVLWKFEAVNNKVTKVPYAPDGLKAKTNDPTTWSSFAVVKAVFDSGGYNGIGFCLLNSGVAAFDLDDCRNSGTGLLHPWAHALVFDRAKTYAEITPSGEGLRVIGLGEGPRAYRNQKVDAVMSCETYRDCPKYITVTCAQLNGSASQLANIDALVDAVVLELDGLDHRSSSSDDDDEEDSEAHRDSEELPQSLTVKLYITNLGAGEVHAGYPSRQRPDLRLHHRGYCEPGSAQPRSGRRASTPNIAASPSTSTVWQTAVATTCPVRSSKPASR